MRVAPIQAVNEFRRRIVVSRFVTAAAVACFATACALTSAVVLARICGAEARPRAWWAVALLAPLAWAAWRASRHLPDVAACAAHVDRRLAFGGLLMTSFEADAATWRGELDRLLRGAPSAAPPVPWRRALLFVLGAAAVLLPALLLGPQKNGVGAPSGALTHELKRLEQKIEKVAAANAVDPETLEMLRERSEELSQRAEDRGDVGWQEADALDAAIDHAVEERVNAMRSLRDQIDAQLADGAAGSAELAALLEQAGEEGGADGSPLASEAGTSSRPVSAMTPEELARLAESMSRNLTDRLKSLAEAGLADAEAARRLEQASRCEGAAASRHRHSKECQGGKCSGSCSRPGEGRASGAEGAERDAKEAEGSGGISRGRGDASLRYLNDTQAGSEHFRSEQLPKGAVMGREWKLKGVGLGEPTARPAEDAGAGSAGSAGTGEASPRRRLAPRHRETVRKFFSLDPEGRPK